MKNIKQLLILAILGGICAFNTGCKTDLSPIQAKNTPTLNEIQTTNQTTTDPNDLTTLVTQD